MVFEQNNVASDNNDAVEDEPEHTSSDDAQPLLPIFSAAHLG